MSVLRDTLGRDPSKELREAHIDPDVQLGVKTISHDTDTQTLSFSGTDPDSFQDYSGTVPLDHVPGGDSFGELIAASSNFPTTGLSRGGTLSGLTWTVESKFADAYANASGGLLHHNLFDAGGDALTSNDADTDGWWLVPRRGSTELRHLKVFLPYGTDAEAVTGTGSNGDFESSKIVRFDNDAIAVVVRYSTQRAARFNDFYVTMPVSRSDGQWDQNFDRSDYSIAIYEHNVVGPAGPAGQGARPPFGLEDFTEATRDKIEDSLTTIQSVDGSELQAFDHQGTAIPVDATPTKRQIVAKTGGGVATLTPDGRFSGTDANNTPFNGRIQGLGSTVVDSATFQIPADRTPHEFRTTTANAAVRREIASMTGTAVAGKIEYSVVNGRARLTFPETGLITANLDEILEVHSNNSSQASALEIFTHIHSSDGTIKEQFADVFAMDDPITSSITEELSRTVPLWPVEAGDYLESHQTYVSAQTNRLARVSIEAGSHITINFYSSVAGALPSQTHSDTEIKTLSGEEFETLANMINGIQGVAFDRTNNRLQDGAQISVSAALLNADTDLKKAQFREALGISSEAVTFIGDDGDLNTLVAQGVYERLTSGALNGEPFAGPYTLFVQAGGSAGQFDLHQTVVNADGIEASRGVIAQASAPATLASAWHIRDPLLELNAAPDGPVVLEVSASDAAHWTKGFTDRIPMRLTSGGGGSYLRGEVNAYGFGIVATAATPWEQRAPRSLLDDGPARGFLHMEVSNAALPDFTVPIDFVLKDNAPGGDTEEETFGAQVWWSAESTFVVRTTAALPTGWISNLQGGAVQLSVRYTDSRNGMVRYVPGSFHSAQTARNRISARSQGGALDVESGTLDWARASNTGQSIIPIPASYLSNVSAPDGRINALVRDFAKTAETDAAARTALRDLMNAAAADGERFDARKALFNLPQGHSNAATPVHALPDIRSATNGEDVYVQAEYARQAYGVLEIASAGRANERGYTAGSFGSLDRTPSGLNLDSILAFDSGYSGSGAADLRGKVFWVRGSAPATFPTTVTINGVSRNLAASSPSFSNRYREIQGLTAAAFGNGKYQLEAFDDSTNRFGTETIDEGDYRADVPNLRWRPLAGQYTRPEVEGWFAPWTLAAFMGTIPRARLPSLAFTDTPRGNIVVSSANQANNELVLATGANLGATGSMAVIQFVGPGADPVNSSKTIRVIDGSWMSHNIVYINTGAGEYRMRLRSRATENDIRMDKVNTAQAWPNGTWSVFTL